jgi:hypothetical protein
LGAIRFVLLAVVFLTTGTIVAVVSNSYLTIPWRIRTCNLTPPLPGLSLADCAAVSTKFYYSGSLYLQIERELIENLEKADVVVLGNSRTQVSFATRATEEYFRKKGLRYFILGSEGSGFRFSQLMLERLHIKPSILLMNNESFYVDVLEDSNKDVVLDPDRFVPLMNMFYYSKLAAGWICSNGPALLQQIYCHGSVRTNWRNPVTGALYIYYIDKGSRHIPITDVPETRLHYFDRFMHNARVFLASPSVKDACMINYVVPSLNSSVELARKMSTAMDVPFVFPKTTNLDSFEGSHLWPESSERWSADFFRLADPYIDQCLARRPRQLTRSHLDPK